MQTQAPLMNADPFPHPREGEETLPPSLACRCGASETAAILGLLDRVPAARQAIEAWDGVSHDAHLRSRQKYARLLADLYERHPCEVLAGLASPRAHTRLWVTLALAEAAAPVALPVLEHALTDERDPLCRRALLKALAACEAARG
ncbi:MAG TPA: hypothetical protein VGN52_10470 [Burkholderiales bacterium]